MCSFWETNLSDARVENLAPNLKNEDLLTAFVVRWGNKTNHPPIEKYGSSAEDARLWVQHYI